MSDKLRKRALKQGENGRFEPLAAQPGERRPRELISVRLAPDVAEIVRVEASLLGCSLGLAIDNIVRMMVAGKDAETARAIQELSPKTEE